MASRADLARIVGQLKGTPGWRDYVQTIQATRDDIIHRLLYEPEAAKVEPLRQEAKVYDTLLNQILKNNEVTSQ